MYIYFSICKLFNMIVWFYVYLIIFPFDDAYIYIYNLTLSHYYSYNYPIISHNMLNHSWVSHITWHWSGLMSAKPCFLNSYKLLMVGIPLARIVESGMVDSIALMDFPHESNWLELDIWISGLCMTWGCFMARGEGIRQEYAAASSDILSKEHIIQTSTTYHYIW